MDSDNESFEVIEPSEDAPAVGEADEEPRAPLWRRVLFGAFVTVAVIFFAGATLYRFGSMWPPSAEAKAAYAELEANGQVPHVTKRQFHIPIPGCVCHSNDPVLAVQHADRRISECMQCHGGGAPGM
ncbi:MAG TPA: hypothetical protein VLA05_06320 [Coriobacteriia bacterium]|nr:hypothetical protein [Coriobacteriia bacterium]